VNEDVFPTALRSNEPETFTFIEKLDRTFLHFFPYLREIGSR
jgi:hypothetical protein